MVQTTRSEGWVGWLGGRWDFAPVYAENAEKKEKFDIWAEDATGGNLSFLWIAVEDLAQMAEASAK